MAFLLLPDVSRTRLMSDDTDNRHAVHVLYVRLSFANGVHMFCLFCLRSLLLCLFILLLYNGTVLD